MYYESKTCIKVHKSFVKEKQIKKALTLLNPRWVSMQYFPLQRNEELPDQFLKFWEQEGDYLILPRAFPIQDFSSCGVLNYVDHTTPGSIVKFKSLIKLKPDQIPAVETMVKQQKGVLCFPCGTGKTVMALEVIARLQKRTIILVHTNVLLKQWKERIKEFLGLEDEDIGILGGGELSYKNKPITIGMIQTLLSPNTPEEVFDYFGVLVADEVHRHAGSEWHKVIHKFSSKIRFGLTATPQRSDKMEKVIFWAIGNIVYRGKNNALKPKIFFINTNTYFPAEKCVFWGTDQISLMAVISKLIKDDLRNELIVSYLQRAANKGRKILILSDRIKHLETLLEMFNIQKLETVTASLFIGDMKEDQRLEAVKADVIFATQHIAKEGLDLPELDTLFIVTPFSNSNRTQQSVGRILRKIEDKQEPVVMDFIDNNIPYLKRMAQKRREIYETLI